MIVMRSSRQRRRTHHLPRRPAQTATPRQVQAGVLVLLPFLCVTQAQRPQAFPANPCVLTLSLLKDKDRALHLCADPLAPVLIPAHTPDPCLAACEGLPAHKASRRRAALQRSSLRRVAPQGLVASPHRARRADLASAAHLQASVLPGPEASLLVLDSHARDPRVDSLPMVRLGPRGSSGRDHPPRHKVSRHGGSSDARLGGYGSARTISGFVRIVALGAGAIRELVYPVYTSFRTRRVCLSF